MRDKLSATKFTGCHFFDTMFFTFLLIPSHFYLVHKRRIQAAKGYQSFPKAQATSWQEKSFGRRSGAAACGSHGGTGGLPSIPLLAYPPGERYAQGQAMGWSRGT